MCSYCGCRANTVIARLSKEHEDITNAMGDLRRAAVAGSDEVVGNLAHVLAALLDPHTVIEEQCLFAELRKEEEFVAPVDGHCGEHRSIDELIAAVAAGDRTAVPVLDEALWRHIDKEENGLFPAAIIAMDGYAWECVVNGIEACDANALKAQASAMRD